MDSERPIVRALLVGLLLGALAALATPLPAQSPPPDVQVVIRPEVRRQLVAAWDDTTATQWERAYCALYRRDQRKGVTQYVVFGVLRAVEDSAVTNAYQVGYACPERAKRDTVSAGITVLHTHPPVTCDSEDRRSLCMVGGEDAWDCGISRGDSTHFRHKGYPFALVQCDRHAVLAWFAPPSAAPRSWARRLAPAGAIGAAAFAGGRLDADRGGYSDTWRTADKREHALGGMALGAVTGWRAACLAGGGWEAGQAARGGYASWRDATATCGGAVVADYLTRRFR